MANAESFWCCAASKLPANFSPKDLSDLQTLHILIALPAFWHHFHNGATDSPEDFLGYLWPPSYCNALLALLKRWANVSQTL
jgi:hypothetical protein